MLNTINISQIYVLDQDEALDFYVGKLGLEVSADFDLGFMRWLTVRVPGEEGREILLSKPGPPGLDPKTAEQVRELVTKGAMGFTIGFRTDDARKMHAELTEKGVEITDGPTDNFYGTDFGARDPFGNPFRVMQPPDGPIGVPTQKELDEMCPPQSK